MEEFICRGRDRGLLIILTTTMLTFLLSVGGQPGFLNINCGGRNNHTDFTTNLTWTVDSNEYIDVGRVANVSNSSIPHHLQSLRYFPKPIKKACYSLPLTTNVTYLLRLWFLFGNYNGKRNLPSFNISVETQGMLTEKVQSIRSAETPQFTAERIITSPNGILYVCLIRTSDDSDPFISAIELRSLSGSLYHLQVRPGTMLNTILRYDLGAQSSDLIRYPQDRFDRFWFSDSSLPGLYNDSLASKGRSNRTVFNNISISGFPPVVVMQTAVIATTTINRLRFHLETQNTTTLVVLYFAEIQTLNASESRIFNVMVNEQIVQRIDTSLQNYSIELPFTYNYTQATEVVISLETIDQPGKSSRGPLLNAIEYYRILESEPETYAGDVDAILSIKRALNIHGWISDPCFDIEWNGVRCNKFFPVRIVEINLSGLNLSGSLPQRITDLTELKSIILHNNHLSGFLPDICSLTKLQIIRLQNNNISGIIPDCLSLLNNLKELNLENNNFSGVVPEGLLKNRLLDLRYSGNPHLCKEGDQCHSKDNKVTIVVGSAIGAAVISASLVLILIITYRRRYNSMKRNQLENINARRNEALSLLVPNPVRSRSFSVEEMKVATQNFSHKIGEGGFGSVYFGKLQNGKDVAVKLLSSSSKQGAAEFLNEIDLLSRLNHKNLVSLLGYCNDFNQLMLVYEHMPQGSLKDHLYGSLAISSKLDWKSRLQLALDAAEGLEYLHVNCTPKIIHRDVKSSNILLDTSLRAKVADFGLSKIIGDDMVSHVTTTIKGTVGYLDPEYFHTSKLTEKSDVYSFGVVLLEIICGRKPIDPELSEEELSLVKWVMLYVEAIEDSGRPLTGIIDKKLSLSDNDLKSFSDLVNLSVKCIQSEASKRPTITEIVLQLKDVISLIKPEDMTEETLCFEDYSNSVLHVGR